MQPLVWGRVVASCILTTVFCLLVLMVAIPRLLNYQGKLTDSDGVGINDTLDITFRLYTESSGGTVLWEETITGVEVSRGLFFVELGTVTSLPDSVNFSDEYWLKVEVAGETLSSREHLTPLPYSLYSLKPKTVEEAIQLGYSKADSTRRTGSFLFRAGEGATLTEMIGMNIFLSRKT